MLESCFFDEKMLDILEKRATCTRRRDFDPPTFPDFDHNNTRNTIFPISLSVDEVK